MRSNRLIILSIITTALLVSSCVTNEKLTYLQYEEGAREEFIAITPATYIIQPYDNLYIRVVTPDPKLSEMFNTIPVTGTSTSVNELTADMLSYSVDNDGAIELPYAGRFIMAGKTLKMVKTELDNALKSYIADAVVTVKLVNNYVSIIGEVQHPGKYPIYKDRLNIFQAIAMASDLNVFSDRQKIKLIRQTTDGNIIKEFSLKERSIIGSEFFYVMPNDVIYAPPMKGRFFKMDAFPYSIILSTITTFVLLWNVLK